MKCFFILALVAIFSCVYGQQDKRRVKVRATGAPAIVIRDQVADHPLRIAAIDTLINGRIGGVAGARQLCNEKSYHAQQSKTRKWRSGNWRAMITSRLQSLWSLVSYQHERERSSIDTLNGTSLWSSWNDFVDGKPSLVSGDEFKIVTFDEEDLFDIFTREGQSEKFAWFGYTPDSEFNDVGTINSSSPHCGNWMSTTGMGPALNLEVFKNTGSISGYAVEMKPCSSMFALLCLEKTAEWEGGFTFSMYGKDVGNRQRGKAVHPNVKKNKLGHTSARPIDRRRTTTRRRS